MRKNHNEEWWKIKQTHISGTEITALLGTNNYNTALGLYESKINPKPYTDLKSSLVANRGVALEPVLLEEYSDQTGYALSWNDGEDRFFPHKTIPFIGCSPDEVAITSIGTTRLVEVKTAIGHGTYKWISGIPEAVAQQVMWGLGVMLSNDSNMEESADVVAMIDNDFKMYELEFNPEMFKAMTEIAVDFWNNNVLKRIPPDASTVAEWNSFYKDAIPDLYVDCDLSEIELMAEIKKIDKEISETKVRLNTERATDDARLSELEKTSMELKMYLRNKMGSASTLRYKGVDVATCKNSASKAKFDMDAFKQVHPEIHKQFIKIESGSRRFNISRTVEDILGDETNA